MTPERIGATASAELVRHGQRLTVEVVAIELPT
jgi:hypothetical protein